MGAASGNPDTGLRSLTTRYCSGVADARLWPDGMSDRSGEHSPSLVGTTVGGRYHLVRLLGDGGVGAVYKAADQVLRRFVAIKLLHPDVATNAKTVERFQREARAAAAIGHPNIIDILDFGYADGKPFLVMEYLRGRSLASAIATDGPMAIDRACRIATHTLAGLASAHERGILHRDLKPANLMLIAHFGDRDFVKICDFGFAALLSPQERIDDSGRALTPARTLVGTPAYAAPERLRGDETRDPRVDVYSVGVVLFEMLAGRRPFDAPTVKELAKMARDQPAPSLLTYRADIPRTLDDVLQAALTKRREDRWPDAEALAEALVPFGGRPIDKDDFTPTDSFTMDLVMIRARERGTQRRLMTQAEQGKPALAAEPEHTEPKATLDPGQAARILAEHRRTQTAVRKREEAREAAAAESRAAQSGSGRAERITPSSLRRGSVPPPPTADEHIRGMLVIPVLRFVADRFGERQLKGILETLPPEAGPLFSDGVAADSWLTHDAFMTLLAQIDAQLGADDLHLVVECGAAAAEGAAERIRAMSAHGETPPELFLAELPQLAQELIAGVEHLVPQIGRGYGRVEVREKGSPSLIGCVFRLGWLDHSIQQLGAKEVEVTMRSCCALGDPRCLFDISWLT